MTLILRCQKISRSPLQSLGSQQTQKVIIISNHYCLLLGPGPGLDHRGSRVYKDAPPPALLGGH